MLFVMWNVFTQTKNPIRWNLGITRFCLNVESTSLWKFFEVLYLVSDLYTLVHAVGAESDYVQLDVNQHVFFVRNTKLFPLTGLFKGYTFGRFYPFIRN